MTFITIGHAIKSGHNLYLVTTGQFKTTLDFQQDSFDKRCATALVLPGAEQGLTRSRAECVE
ncbi:hypothetical protein KBT16_09360 [Nostoc sp. CCCryo 231-06]|nr:hypothetical protein [Nostoc sp. CCCryo 231-06]